MPKFTAYVDPLEGRVLSELSLKNLMAYAEAICQWERESGSSGEKKAFDFIEKELRSLRLAVYRDEVESFISLPETGSIEVASLSSEKISGRPPSFSASTPEDGVMGDLLYLGAGEDSAYAGKDLSGKIVLIDGLPSPRAARTAEDHGAMGLIFSGGDHLHSMIVTTLWGMPTYSRKEKVPRMPCLSVVKKEGVVLKGLLKNQSIALRIKTKVWTGFKNIPILTGHLRGEVEKERFLLLSGHVDSWHYGAFDNGTGNATMLEVARLLRKHKAGLRRGVRFAFWSGHSHGRYAGSTWYADHFWEDLEKNCIGHLNADCLGARGATDYSDLFATEDLWDLAEKLILDCAGQRVKGKHFPRAGDQSFWGLGLPSLFMVLSGVPPEEGSDLGESTARFVGTGGLPWFWHTTEDTLDKIDPEIFALDTRIYLSAALRLCNSPVLPLNEETLGREILKALETYEQGSGGLADLSRSTEAGKGFLRLAKKLNRAIDDAKLPKGASVRIEGINSCLMKVSRNLVWLNYHGTGPFDQDPAVPLPPVPLLEPVSMLSKLDPRSDDFKFLKNEIVRLENRVVHSFHQASESILESGLVKK
jgi:hypothetical protein